MCNMCVGSTSLVTTTNGTERGDREKGTEKEYEEGRVRLGGLCATIDLSLDRPPDLPRYPRLGKSWRTQTRDRPV